MYTERFQILLSQPQRRRLEQEARRRGVSIAAVIRAALDRELGASGVDERQGALEELRTMRATFVSIADLNEIIGSERDAVARGASGISE